jgi:hypothetical protein
MTTLAIGTLILVIYCLPTIVAERYRHPNSSAICALNFFLGWTLLGWVVALVWALTKASPADLSRHDNFAVDTVALRRNIEAATGAPRSPRLNWPRWAILAGGGAIVVALVLGNKQWLFENKGDKASISSIADSSAHVDRTAIVAPPQDANKLNSPPSDIKAAQNRLIELGFLAGPSDGVWGSKSRVALRAFKTANGLAADDKWDDLVSGRLYSTQAARSPLPLATTGK